MWFIGSIGIFVREWIFTGLSELTGQSSQLDANTNVLDLERLWNPPNDSEISNLKDVIDGEGVYGFIFNDSAAPAGNDYYGGYNHCNMPHVKKEKYVKVPEKYTLQYVEVVNSQHHQKISQHTNLHIDPSSPQTHPLRREYLSPRNHPLGLHRRRALLLRQTRQLHTPQLSLHALVHLHLSLKPLPPNWLQRNMSIPPNHTRRSRRQLAPRQRPIRSLPRPSPFPA